MSKEIPDVYHIKGLNIIVSLATLIQMEQTLGIKYVKDVDYTVIKN